MYKISRQMFCSFWNMRKQMKTAICQFVFSIIAISRISAHSIEVFSMYREDLG